MVMINCIVENKKRLINFNDFNSRKKSSLDNRQSSKGLNFNRQPSKLHLHWDPRLFRKIPLIIPGVLFVQKAVLLGLPAGELIFGGAYYWKEFCVSKWTGLDYKNSLKHYENRLKQLKRANTNRPHGLIFGRAYYRKDFCVWYLGNLFSGGLITGGAYYRNFTVFILPKRLFWWAYFGGLIIEGSFAYQDNYNKKTSLNQLETLTDHRPTFREANYRRKGFLRMRLGGSYFREGLIVFVFVWEEGYYRNFTVSARI